MPLNHFTTSRIKHKERMEIWEEIAFDRERGAKRLVAELGDRLLTAAFQITQNAADAEDLVFRTFAQVVMKIDQYDGRSAFFTWIYRILLNFRRMDLRKKGANALVFMEQLPETEDPAPDPAEALAIDSSAAEIRAGVAKLPEVLRETVVLHYFEGLGVSEIAAVAEIPVGTVKYRLFEARRQLARLLVQTNFRNAASKQNGGEERQVRRADR